METSSSDSKQTGSELAELDISSPSFLADPHPTYRKLRESDPIHWSPRLRAFVVTRYDDVQALLRGAEDFGLDYLNQKRLRSGSDEVERPYVQLMSRTAGTLDGEGHRRVREVFRRAFTPRRAELLRAEVTEVAGRLVSAFLSAGGGDLVGEVALPMPQHVIGGMLAVPKSDHAQLAGWSRDLAVVFQGLRMDEAARSRADVAATRISDYFEVKLSAPLPPDTLIADMASAAHDGRVDKQELIANLVVLYIAGFDTTANLIGMSVLHLLRHRDQWSRMQRDLSLVSAASAELARFDSPGVATSRIAFHDTQLATVPIPAGSSVFAVLTSANRDPQHFQRPDELDIERRPTSRPMVFGSGLHSCPGQAIAMLEVESVLAALAAARHEIHLLDESPEFLPTPFMRGLRSLDLAVSR